LYLIPGGVGGTEIYLRSLVRALAEVDKTNRYILFVNCETGTDLAPAAPNFDVAMQHVRAVHRPARILWEQFVLPWQVRRWKIDVLFNPGFTAPAINSCPQVTVFHDLQHKRHPENFRWFDLPFWRFFVWLSAVRSERLIAVSESTRKDLLLFYALPPTRIVTVQHGVDPRFFEIGRLRQRAAPERLLLCVSTLHPHKNIERLVRAFAAFHPSHPDYRLVLAGMKGFHARAVERLVSELGLSSNITITGWTPREELYDLYRRAAVFLYPSTFEGFGMPVVEALAAGIPTACSGIEPLLSIAGGAALFFPPQDEQRITATMKLLIENVSLRDRLALEGPKRAAIFSWERAARETLAVIEAAAQRSKSSN
jgi:glycosyltransferase involved in cell wall biosynthesis